MKIRTIVTGIAAMIFLAGGAYAALNMSATAPEVGVTAEVTEVATPQRAAPRLAMRDRQPTPPAESTRIYVNPSTQLQTGEDGITPMSYDCTFEGGQAQECWCDTPLDCKDMVLNGPCGDDDVWWTSGEDTLGCTVQD